MSLYIDFVNPAGVCTDENAINNAIRNILMTPIGTLPGKPTFGSRIMELVFSQIDDLTIKLLKDIIIDALSYWELRVRVIDVTISPDDSMNRIFCTITYQYLDAGLVTASVNLGINY